MTNFVAEAIFKRKCAGKKGLITKKRMSIKNLIEEKESRTKL